MRMVLERAMGRASSSLSPGHRHFAGQVKHFSISAFYLRVNRNCETLDFTCEFG